MAFFGIIVNRSLQILKSIHLVCLSFWDISRDPGFRIFILTHKFWTLVLKISLIISRLDKQKSVSLLAYLHGAWGVFHLTQVRGISIWLPKISSAEDEIERETFLVKSWSRWGGCVDNLGDWDQAARCLNINILLPESLFTHFAMGYSAFPLSWPGVSREPLSLTLITNEPAIAFTIDDIHL